MKAKFKYEVIYAHREEYPVAVMCEFFGVSKSGYYDYVKRISRVEKTSSWLRKSACSRNVVSKLMATGECIFGLNSKVSTTTPRRYCES